MRATTFGPTGVRVPVIGEGTWNMERDREDEAIAAIRLAIELGATHIDTAELYGRGRVETMVGRALAGLRDRVYLVSKVLPDNASLRGTVRACERSLERLGTDRLDCYLLHWPGRHPLAETVEGFRELVAAGKIAAWGVSNFDTGELEALAQIAEPSEIACNQVLYHLEQRAIEHRVLPWCRARGIATVAYSPLGSGSFVRPDSAGGEVLAEIAVRHGATAEQIALAWLVRAPDVLAIPKATRPEHVRANVGAGALVLDPADIEAIDRAFPAGRARGLPTI